MGSYNYCLCFTRKFRWVEAQPPTDVKEAFAVYAEGGSHMNTEQLRRFLADVQGDAGATASDAERVMEQVRQLRHRHSLGKLSKPLLAPDDFHHFLFSDDLNPPLRSQVHQDMTAPLSHYYIYTGHKSYLTGNQLSSDCSDVPIIKALERGVRVIELDIWPNSTNDDINVRHGRYSCNVHYLLFPSHVSLFVILSSAFLCALWIYLKKSVNTDESNIDAFKPCNLSRHSYESYS